MKYLSALSAVWMGMHFVCDDPLSVAVLHAAFNVGGTWDMALQPPWASASA